MRFSQSIPPTLADVVKVVVIPDDGIRVADLLQTCICVISKQWAASKLLTRGMRLRESVPERAVRRPSLRSVNR